MSSSFFQDYLKIEPSFNRTKEQIEIQFLPGKDENNKFVFYINSLIISFYHLAYRKRIKGEFWTRISIEPESCSWSRLDVDVCFNDEFTIELFYVSTQCRLNQVKELHELITNEELGDIFWFVVMTDFYIDYIDNYIDTVNDVLQASRNKLKTMHENKLIHNSYVIETVKEFKFYDDITNNVLAKYL